jgi:hypothetical protein
MAIFHQNIDGPVSGTAINNDMLKMWILLVENAFNVFLYVCSLIERRGNDGYEGLFPTQLLLSSLRGANRPASSTPRPKDLDFIEATLPLIGLA